VGEAAADRFRGRLRQALALRDRTQGWLERRIRVSRGYISSILSGRRNASVEVKASMSKVLGVRAPWLLYGDGQPELAQGVTWEEDILDFIRQHPEHKEFGVMLYDAEIAYARSTEDYSVLTKIEGLKEERKARGHSHEAIERYPSREVVLSQARANPNVPTGAIEGLLARRLKSDEDPGADFWTGALIEEIRRAKRIAAVVAEDEGPDD
jgi:transcriptional regulator with XRE-family HTH domain